MPKPKNTTIPDKVVILAEKIWKAANKPRKTRRKRRVVTYVCSALVMLADYEGMTIDFDTCPECGKIAVVARDGKILCPYCEEQKSPA